MCHLHSRGFGEPPQGHGRAAPLDPLGELQHRCIAEPGSQQRIFSRALDIQWEFEITQWLPRSQLEEVIVNTQSQSFNGAWPKQSKPTGSLETSESHLWGLPYCTYIWSSKKGKDLKGRESDWLSNTGNLSTAARPNFFALSYPKLIKTKQCKISEKQTDPNEYLEETVNKELNIYAKLPLRNRLNFVQTFLTDTSVKTCCHWGSEQRGNSFLNQLPGTTQFSCPYSKLQAATSPLQGLILHVMQTLGLP